MRPPKFFDRFNIDVRISHEAKKIDKENKKILINKHKIDKEYELSNDYLLLSPGSIPIVPPFKGLEDVPIFTLRTIPDSVKIKEYRDKEILLICYRDTRSMMAAQLLANVRYKDVRILTGGMMTWYRKGYPIEKAYT